LKTKGLTSFQGAEWSLAARPPEADLVNPPLSRDEIFVNVTTNLSLTDCELPAFSGRFGGTGRAAFRPLIPSQTLNLVGATSN
jgi:hypothetical protein